MLSPPPGSPASARRASSQVSGEFGATRRSAAVLRMIAGLTTRMLARNRRPDLSYAKGPAPASAQPQVVEREQDLEHDQRHDHPLHALRVEWMIVALIVLEIQLTLYDLWLR